MISFRIYLISLLFKGLSRVFSSTTVRNHKFFSIQPSLWFNSHIHTWLLEKPQLWLCRPMSAKWCLCFLICCIGLSYFYFREQVSFNFMASVTIHSDFGSPRKYNVIVSTISPSIYHEVMGPDAMILVFWMLYFKPAFSLSSLTLIKRLFSSSSLSPITVVSLAYLRLL